MENVRHPNKHLHTYRSTNLNDVGYVDELAVFKFGRWKARYRNCVFVPKESFVLPNLSFFSVENNFFLLVFIVVIGSQCRTLFTRKEVMELPPNCNLIVLAGTLIS